MSVAGKLSITSSTDTRFAVGDEVTIELDDTVALNVSTSITATAIVSAPPATSETSAEPAA